MKPINVLVSNQHYCHKSSFSSEYEQSPIVCKIADFSLSRSLETQTRSIVQSRTNDICRRTAVYMAPELLMSITKGYYNGFKKMDVLSLGMLSFATINPNLSTPYSKMIEELNVEFSPDPMKEFMANKKLPVYDDKYESIRVAEWWQREEYCFLGVAHLTPIYDHQLKNLFPFSILMTQ